MSDAVPLAPDASLVNDGTGILDDEADQGEQQRLEKERRAQFVTDLRAIMSAEQGRRFVWWLVDELTCVLSGSFVQGDGGSHGTAFNEGKRSAGITLMQHVQRLAPADYVLMLGEAVSRTVGIQSEDADA